MNCETVIGPVIQTRNPGPEPEAIKQAFRETQEIYEAARNQTQPPWEKTTVDISQRKICPRKEPLFIR